MDLSEETLRNPITRRALLRRASMGAAGLTVAPGLLAACGSSSGTSATNAAAAPVRGKTIRMINYVDWIGANEAAQFKEEDRHDDPADRRQLRPDARFEARRRPHLRGHAARRPQRCGSTG